jgi:hypothetical protein
VLPRRGRRTPVWVEVAALGLETSQCLSALEQRPSVLAGPWSPVLLCGFVGSRGLLGSLQAASDAPHEESYGLG